MRKISILLLAGLAMLVACTPSKKPPTGRWIGNFESASVMVDTRLEILSDGTVRVSAPNFLNVGDDISEERRAVMHGRLADELGKTWSLVAPRKMDFDGRVFRKSGGVAPQMEWNPMTEKMVVVFYFGMQKSIRIDMKRVDVFGDDPWAAPQ
jgi:hypothetical protein